MFRREHHSPTSTESTKYSPTVSVRRRWKYRKEEVEATTVQSSLWIRVVSILSLVALPDLRVVEKTTFVARLLRNAPSMINPAPEHITWYYGEWQSAYENLDIPNVRLEQGLPTVFDTGKRNVVVLGYFHQEKSSLEHVRHIPRAEAFPETSGESNHKFERAIHGRVQESPRCLTGNAFGETYAPGSCQVCARSFQ